MSLEGQARSMAQRYGIPEGIFLGLIRAESSWNPNAVSRVGALGLTQVMPNTARGMGYDPAQLARNPQMQLEAGAKYLSQMYKRFGTWDIALAAYNAGPGNVQKYGGIPPFKETQNYVPRVLRFAKEYGGGSVPTAGGSGKPPMQEITLLPQSPEFPGWPGHTSSTPAPTMDIASLLEGLQPSMDLARPLSPSIMGQKSPHETFREIASRGLDRAAEQRPDPLPSRADPRSRMNIGIDRPVPRETPQERESLKSLPEQVRAMNLRQAWDRWTGRG